MFLSDFSIKRPIATVVLILMLMCMGLLALSKLRVNQSPDVKFPLIVVNVPYPGASPDTVEHEVINRIEKSLQSITGVDHTESTAHEGSAEILVFFKFSKNMIEASDEIRNAIGTIRYKLPTEIREPVLERVEPSADPMMTIALSSTTQSLADISRLAEDRLAEKFRAIDGVATVSINGALHRELSVLLQAQKLREYNVSISDVVNALRIQNTNAPAGKIKGELSDQSIRLVGRIGSPAEFEHIGVKRNGDQVVQLGQVATIEDSFAEKTGYSIRNMHPNVSMYIVRSNNASTITVADKVRSVVAEINATLPQGTHVDITWDGGKTAQNSLNNVIDSLLFGAILTVLVVFVFLNSWRSTLITALSLPTSVMAAFIAVWLCGFTLNFMTLLGLSLAIGVLIDDAIVVRENIVRHMEMGKDRRTAASEGTREIGLAVASTTFSIIAVFIPVAFMQGVSGEWFRPFALTVAISVLVSLFISFTLDPMLSAYWGDPVGHHHQVKSGLSLYLQRFNTWFDRQADRYGRVIGWALHHRRWMASIALISFIGALVLHAYFGGSSFLPKNDGSKIAIDIRTFSSASLNYNRLKVEKAAEVARLIPEAIATNSYVNNGGGTVNVDIGKSTERHRTAAQIAVELRSYLQRLVGAEYTVQDDLNNGGDKPVQLQFYGSDSRRLTAITNDYMERLRHVKGAVDVGLSELPPKDELQIELNRGLANNLGISVSDAAQAIRVAFAGVEVGDWIDPTGEARDVAVRLHPNDRKNINSIEQLPVAVSANGGNTLVPLNQIANISMGKSPAEISHKNSKRIINVSANVEGRSAGEVTTEALAIAKAIDFPAGFGIELDGQAKDQNDLFAEMGIALIMGIGLMFFILVMQFGSFTAPIPVMLSLPLSLIGVVLALIITRDTLNLMSFIGVIMLMGLVAKNAILLLDCARKQEALGHEREEALMIAGRLRLRPILMTTFALIAGMLPVAIGLGEGGGFYRPLAVAIIGGTITSTLLTLLVVPTFYDSIEIAKDRMIAKYHRRAAIRNPLIAFIQTGIEALLALTLMRWIYRRLAGLAISIIGRLKRKTR